MIGSTARAVEPSFRQVFLAGDGLADETLERRVYIVRKRIEHEVGAPGGEGSVYFPSLSCRTLVYKGMLTTPQLGRVLPRPARRAGRVGAGPGALPLLHQHVPVVAAGPPVPLHRPQRRDQHGAGQPQLDAGPRGAAGQRPAARRPRAHLPHLHPRGQRLGHLRRGARAAAHGRLLAAPRRADDDPRGVGEPPPHERGAPRPSTATTRRSWSRGTARRRSPSPTAPSWAPCSTATACARRATG